MPWRPTWPGPRIAALSSIRLSEKLGAIDVLVNNAAVTYFEPSETFSARHYALMLEVQVRAPFELAQLVLPGMRARKQGWILNISSGAARHPEGPPYSRRGYAGTVYGMCKATLERFTSGLAAELYEDGIAVNALSPSGLVPTPGVVYHGLDRDVPADALEPAEVMAESRARVVQRRSGGVDRSNHLCPTLPRGAVLQLIRRAS